MKLQLWLLPTICVYLILISATSIRIDPKPVVAAYKDKASLLLSSNTIKAHKLNFFQRFMIKVFFKKYKKMAELKADKLAGTSLAFGIAACAFIVLGLITPIVILAAIPAGITALITGKSALRQGTSKEGAAKTGKALGLGALLAFAVLLIAAVIFIYSWGHGQ